MQSFLKFSNKNITNSAFLLLIFAGFHWFIKIWLLFWPRLLLNELWFSSELQSRRTAGRLLVSRFQRKLAPLCGLKRGLTVVSSLSIVDDTTAMIRPNRYAQTMKTASVRHQLMAPISKLLFGCSRRPFGRLANRCKSALGLLDSSLPDSIYANYVWIEYEKVDRFQWNHFAWDWLRRTGRCKEDARTILLECRRFAC